MSKFFTLIVYCVFALFFLNACSGLGGKFEGTTPVDNKDARREKRGKLSGDDGFTLFGGKKEAEENASPIGVNSFLWRATIDTLAFMPLASADPCGSGA